jgi:hypothetical protein
MGNIESSPTSESHPSKSKAVSNPINSDLSKVAEPIETPGKRQTPIVTDSLVTGSPLGQEEQSSVRQSSWFMKRRKDSFDIDSQLSSKQAYVQPKGEKDYSNSSRIVHAYGPSGLAPLSALNDKKVQTIPVQIVWSQPGKVVYLTGSFNDWKKKIRLQKSVEDFATIIDFPPGRHRLKFIIDEEWKCSDDLEKTLDEEGIEVNELLVLDPEGRSNIDGLEDTNLEAGAELCKF